MNPRFVPRESAFASAGDSGGKAKLIEIKFGIQFIVPFTTLLVANFFKFCLQGVFGGSGDKTVDMINGTRRNVWYLAHLHLLVVVLLIYRSELLSKAY